MEIGEKVFVITDKVVPDRGLKLLKGKVLAIKPNDLDLDDISVDFGKRLGIHTFREDELYYTAKDTLNFAYAKNFHEQNKLAEQWQDLIKIEADLKLKRLVGVARNIRIGRRTNTGENMFILKIMMNIYRPTFAL